MRIAALVFPALVALGLAAGCGGGCTHGNHRHATGSQWENPPNYTDSCTCSESGEIECNTSARNTAGGVALN